MSNYKKISEKYLKPADQDTYYCTLPDENWNRWIKNHGFPSWSEGNCELFFVSLVEKKCSLLQAVGFQQSHDEDDANLTKTGNFTVLCRLMMKYLLFSS